MNYKNQFFLAISLQPPKTHGYIRVKDENGNNIMKQINIEQRGTIETMILGVNEEGRTYIRITTIIVEPPATRLNSTWNQVSEYLETTIPDEFSYGVFRKNFIIVGDKSDSLLDAKRSGAHLYGKLIAEGIFNYDELKNTEVWRMYRDKYK